MVDAAPAAPVDVRAILAPERDALLDLLGSLEPDAWDAPTECPAWTVQGIALHVLGDDLSLLSRQRDTATDSLTIFAESHPGLGFRELLDGFNEQWVTASRFLSGALLIELLRISGTWTNTFYAATDPLSLGEPVLLFNERRASPYWQIVGREYVERWVHQHQIRRALGRRDLDGSFLRPACDVIVRALTASMPALGAATGQCIVFEVARLGAWTLVREPDRWALAPRAVERADVTVRVGPARATAVFARGLTAAEITGTLECSGDTDLGAAVASWVAPVLGRP